RFIGRGFYNPKPALCCRILTWTDEPLDAAFFQRRLEAAAGLRAQGHPQGAPTLCRLVWSEADGLPGLVVDRYGPVLVAQCLTLGMARARPLVTGALGRLLPDATVFDMDDPHAAQLEGFSAALGWAGAAGPRTVRVTEAGATFEVTIGAGHKTGLYLDQRENRARLRAPAPARPRRFRPPPRLPLPCPARRRQAPGLHRVFPRRDRRRPTQPGAQRRRGPGGDSRGERLRRAAKPRARRRALRRDRPGSAAVRAQPLGARRGGPRLQGDQPACAPAARARRQPLDVLVLASRVRRDVREYLPRGGCRRGRPASRRRAPGSGFGPPRAALDPRDSLPQRTSPCHFVISSGLAPGG